SVNPEEIIQKVEFGTSPLKARIRALNQMAEAGYKVGILIAPVVLVEHWQELYAQLIEQLAELITPQAKKKLFIEIIFMTYSFIHRAINQEAFPNAMDLYDQSLMTGRGRGKYWYKETTRVRAEEFLRKELTEKLKGIPILYVV
ncbi:MAG: spore photoproduct lyase family protein, partial [Desulfitobacterium hafniense]